MTRYPKFMVGAVSAAALALPFALNTAGLAQEAPVEAVSQTDAAKQPDQATVAQEARPAAEDAVSFIEFKTPAAPAASDAGGVAEARIAQATPAAAEPAAAAETTADPEAAAPQATRQIVVERQQPKVEAKVDENVAAADATPAAKTEEVAQATPETAETPAAAEATKVATPAADPVQATRQIVVEQKAEEAAPVVAAKTEEAAVPAETQAQPETAPAEQQAAAETPEAAQEQTVAEKTQAEKPVAAKPEADTTEKTAEAPAKRDTLEIVAELQTELKRVGCYFGAIDGVWGPRSAYALDSYSAFAEVEHDSYEPSEAWIAHVKAQKNAVCHDGHYYGYAKPYSKPTYRQDYGYHSPYSYQDSYGGDYYGRGGYYGRY